MYKKVPNRVIPIGDVPARRREVSHRHVQTPNVDGVLLALRMRDASIDI